jgi:hypothetical protein
MPVPPRGFAKQNPGGNRLRKGLVAIPSGLLLVHAAWIEAEIPQERPTGATRNWSG